MESISVKKSEVIRFRGNETNNFVFFVRIKPSSHFLIEWRRLDEYTKIFQS